MHPCSTGSVADNNLPFFSIGPIGFLLGGRVGLATFLSPLYFDFFFPFINYFADGRDLVVHGGPSWACPADSLDVEIPRWGTLGGGSIRATKQASMRGLSMPTLQDAIEATYPAVRAMQGSEDYIEGPRAFAEKRAPNWRGK